MTNQDLRLKYKMDTGNNAVIEIDEDVHLDSDLTIEELSEPIEIEVVVEIDDVPYIEWLEEQLIKQLNK